MSTEGYDAAAAEPPDQGLPQPCNASVIAAWCVHYLAATLERPPDQVDVTASFSKLGMDSVIRTSFMFAIEEWLNVTIPADYMLERSTIAQLANHLASRVGTQTSGSASRASTRDSLGTEGTVGNAGHRCGRPQAAGTSGEARTLMRRLLIATSILLLLGIALWLTANIYFHCCTPPT